MKQTDQTLLEQMRITEFELEHRKGLYAFTVGDAAALSVCRAVIEQSLDSLVAEFYESQTSVTEIALLIGDADTLERLRAAQRRYVLDLFRGTYDLEYVNNRLRIGLVHKRIGVEPKLYLSAIYALKALIGRVISQSSLPEAARSAGLAALEKLIFIDTTLVVETYIRSLIAEIAIAKDRSDFYAQSLEAKVRERTLQLEEQSRTDALTGLLNVRALEEMLKQSLSGAERRNEPVSLAYLDIDHFKQINDHGGHQLGDEMLRRVGNSLRTSVRAGDSCFRYGGDEFCVILMNCRAEDAEERFLARLASILDGVCNHMTVSYGVAQTGPDAYIGGTALIREADERMLASKLRARQGDLKIRLAPPRPSGHFDANDSGQQIERFAQTAGNRR